MLLRDNAKDLAHRLVLERFIELPRMLCNVVDRLLIRVPLQLNQVGLELRAGLSGNRNFLPRLLPHHHLIVEFGGTLCPFMAVERVDKLDAGANHLVPGFPEHDFSRLCDAEVSLPPKTPAVSGD